MLRSHRSTVHGINPYCCGWPDCSTSLHCSFNLSAIVKHIKKAHLLPKVKTDPHTLVYVQLDQLDRWQMKEHTCEQCGFFSLNTANLKTIMKVRCCWRDCSFVAKHPHFVSKHIWTVHLASVAKSAMPNKVYNNRVTTVTVASPSIQPEATNPQTSIKSITIITPNSNSRQAIIRGEEDNIFPMKMRILLLRCTENGCFQMLFGISALRQHLNDVHHVGLFRCLSSWSWNGTELVNQQCKAHFDHM